MEYEFQLKLQSYLDGELSEGEAGEVANRLARDQEAVRLLGELRNTRQALKGFDQGVTLPESREFFWSKIEREIRRQETQPVRPRVPIWAAWQRYLMPMGAAAVMLIAGLIALQSFLPAVAEPTVESADADSGAFTYHDYASGATLVWLSYPAENDFAPGEPAATLP